MQRLASGTELESSSIRPFVEAGFRYRRLWVTVVLITIATTLVASLLTHRQYQSEMNILVANARGNYQITPERTMGTVTVNDVTEEQINSEIEVLRSRSLANMVVNPHWTERSVTTWTREQLRDHDKAVEYFKKHLAISLVRKSNIIHVTYTAGDPYTARDTLQRLLDAFLAKHREIGHPAGTAHFFASEAARYKKELDDAQQQLTAYQQEQNIVSLPDTEAMLDRKISDAQTDLRNTDAQVSEVTRRLGTQTQQLGHIPNRQATQERTIPNDYSVERLNTLLAELQNQRTSLLTKFRPDDRLVQNIDQQIVNTKSALANAQQMRSQERSSDVNPAWQMVTSSIIQNESERQAMKARRSALAQQIAQLQDNLAGVENSTVAFTTLHQKVAELQSNYQLYTQKRDEAQVADAMDENKLLNVAVAQAPTFTITAFRPKPLINFALGTFTALFLAGFMVFFAEMGRTTVATPHDLDRLSRYPLLATVPLDLDGASKQLTPPSRSSHLSIILSPEDSFAEVNRRPSTRRTFAKEA